MALLFKYVILFILPPLKPCDKKLKEILTLSRGTDKKVKWCLLLTGSCLHSFLISLSLSSLWPSHKSGSHTCVSLPPPPLPHSVTPYIPTSPRLPPLAFIRTVDGESRAAPPHTPRCSHTCKALPYVKVNTGAYASCIDCQQSCGTVYCVKNRMTQTTGWCFWSQLGNFFTEEVEEPVKVKLQGQRRWGGSVNPGFLVEWVQQFLF